MNDYTLFMIEFNRCYLPVILSSNELNVPIKPIFQNIGLNWKHQSKKNPKVFQDFGWLLVSDKRLDGSINLTQCIRLSDLEDYIKSIELNSVPYHLRDKLAKYQCDCAQTLIRSLNSPDLDGVVSITTPGDPSFYSLAAMMRWKESALKELGVYIGE